MNFDENARWTDGLRSSGASQSETLEDLRRFLIRGLARSFSEMGESFAEDIVQEALLKILSNLESFQNRSRFTTWAMSVAVRLAISQKRRRHWRDVSLEELSAGESEAPQALVQPDALPGDTIDRDETLARLDRLIETELTDKQRLALRAELAGMPIEEIASRLNTNANALYKTLHDARKRLKKLLQATEPVAGGTSRI